MPIGQQIFLYQMIHKILSGCVRDHGAPRGLKEPIHNEKMVHQMGYENAVTVLFPDTCLTTRDTGELGLHSQKPCSRGIQHVQSLRSSWRMTCVFYLSFSA